MVIGIGCLVLLAILVIIVLILCIKLKKKGQSQPKTISSNQSRCNMELSPPKPSSRSALGVNRHSKQEKADRELHHNIGAIPLDNSGQYETMPAHRQDDQDHIYSKI